MATVIYSVLAGTNNDLKVSSTISISSGTATFPSAETATLMGVGCEVSYNDGSAKLCYIQSKISTTQWTVCTATGGTPANCTDATLTYIKHTFTSLSSAETNATGASYLNKSDGDLTAITTILRIACYSDGTADTTTATIDGWTTSLSYYIEVFTPSNTNTECNASQGHGGKWNDSVYRINAASDWNYNFTINEAYTKITGLQITGKTTNSYDGIYLQANTGGVVLNRCIMKGSGRHGIQVATNGTSYIRNTIVYNSDNKGIWVPATTSTVLYAENCGSFANGDYGFHVTAFRTLHLKNCYSGGNTGADLFKDTNGTLNITTSRTEDGSESTTTAEYTTSNFTNITSGSEDFHLPVGSALIDQGTDLSASFTDDIDGVTRTGTWDIGADEYVASGGPLTFSGSDVSTVTDGITPQFDQFVTGRVDALGITESISSSLDQLVIGLVDPLELTDTVSSGIAGITAVVSGTAIASIVESDIVTGGKTIIITLTGDEWISE